MRSWSPFQSSAKIDTYTCVHISFKTTNQIRRNVIVGVIGSGSLEVPEGAINVVNMAVRDFRSSPGVISRRILGI